MSRLMLTLTLFVGVGATWVATAAAPIVQGPVPMITLDKFNASKNQNKIDFAITVDWKAQTPTRIDADIVPVKGGWGLRFFDAKFNPKKKDKTTMLKKMAFPLPAGDYGAVFLATFNNDKVVGRSDAPTTTVTGDGKVNGNPIRFPDMGKITVIQTIRNEKLELTANYVRPANSNFITRNFKLIIVHPEDPKTGFISTLQGDGGTVRYAGLGTPDLGPGKYGNYAVADIHRADGLMLGSLFSEIAFADGPKK